MLFDEVEQNAYLISNICAQHLLNVDTLLESKKCSFITIRAFNCKKIL